MPYLAGEQTTKITIRLFTKDVEYLKRLEPNGYQVLVREIVRSWIKAKKKNKRTNTVGANTLTTTIVALDNLTLSTDEPVDPKVLLAVGELQNHYLEKNRDGLTRAFSDLICFGHCEIPLKL